MFQLDIRSIMDVEDDLDAFLTKEDILGYYIEVNSDAGINGPSADRSKLVRNF